MSKTAQWPIIFLACLALFPWPWADARVKPPPLAGWASQYAEGVMERVIRLRQEWGQLPLDLSAYNGAVAVRQCADIGDTVWLRVEGGEWERFIAADCGCPIGKKWMEDHNVWVEVDYETAARGGFVGRLARVEMLR